MGAINSSMFSWAIALHLTGNQGCGKRRSIRTSRFHHTFLALQTSSIFPVRGRADIRDHAVSIGQLAAKSLNRPTLGTVKTAREVVTAIPGAIRLGHFLLHCGTGLKAARVARLLGISRPTASRPQGLTAKQALQQAHHRMDGRPYGKGQGSACGRDDDGLAWGDRSRRCGRSSVGSGGGAEEGPLASAVHDRRRRL
jgi:hypothetical protein